MSAQIIQLRKQQTRAPQGDTRQRYFCQRCDCEQFKVYADGELHCVNCGSLIRNLLVSAKP